MKKSICMALIRQGYTMRWVKPGQGPYNAKMGTILTNNSHFTEGYRSNLQCQVTVIMTGCSKA
ncbi:MAG: hypothetical protein R6V34_03120 [Bacteroidales bacterium]